MVDFSISSFVDQFSYGFPSWISILFYSIPKSNIWLNSSKKISGGFVNSNESTVVKLTKSKKS